MTLGELAIALGVMGAVTAGTIPRLLTGLDDARAAGAVRYMSSRLADARMDAVSRSKEVAIRFAESNGTYTFATYEDGNNNGVLTRDILRGVDRPIVGPERLSDHFQNVDFGTAASLPAIDSGSAPPAGDPIKFGVGNSVSFSRLGSATSGTLYILGTSGAQYAIRVVGGTGKIRTYHYNKGTGKWLPM
jgi:hypothetical protein